jgi:hypothetical protein
MGCTIERKDFNSIATCNRLHEIDQRLARGLLMTQDRLAPTCSPHPGVHCANARYAAIKRDNSKDTRQAPYAISRRTPHGSRQTRSCVEMYSRF